MALAFSRLAPEHQAESMIEMRSAIAILAFVLIPASALAAKLPLEDGDYTRGQCNAGSSDYMEPFDIRRSRMVRRKEAASSILKPKAKKELASSGVLALPAQDSLDRRNVQTTDHELNMILELINFR